ncbi:MAG: hypothetical protein HC768_23905 [Acaryochloris sp. CRU_2_0]|nr:hypothetical protein [Acaryochloris sp. CRU_2_0]
MGHLLYWFVQGSIQILQPLIVPICCVVAWGLVLLGIWSIVSAMREGITNAKQMHKIPCANCQFFTKNYLLKCPIHPLEALSEAAVNCLDYEPEL